MNRNPGPFRFQAILTLLLLLGGSASFAQRSNSTVLFPVSMAKSSQKLFADLTAAAAADPADAVCARSATGSVVSDPPAVSSTNGTLEVSFHFQTTVDAQGLTRYCYVYTTPAGQAEEAPTLEVNPGDQLILHFYNDLPVAAAAAAHMHSMQMHPTASATPSDCSATTITASSTNIHFHGTNVAPVCHQDEVLKTIVQPQASFDYTVLIPANEPPGAYWYHPHPHGFSDAQVIGGATGVILVGGIQNVNPIVANLPQRVFVLRDQELPASQAAVKGKPLPQTDLSINYVPVLYPAYVPATIQTPPAEQEFWRVLNTSADTVVNLAVVVNGVAQPLQIVSVDGVPLTDGNGNAITTTQTSYVMSPASRVEFVVTTPAAGAAAQLVSQSWDNGPTGDADPARPLANILSTGGATAAAPSAASPKRLPAQTHSQPVTRFAALAATAPAAQRKLYFSVKPDFSEFYITVDGQTPSPFNMDGPPDITVTEGTVEQWTIENRSTMDHNFHIHQLHFQTLAVNGTPVTDLTKRDTINIPHWSGNAADPYPSVTLQMDFRDPNIVGTFVYHCHILSHEDRGMMAKIQVLPGATTTSLAASPTTAPFNSSVALTATVAPAAGSGTPTGTVTFQNGASTLGTATLDASGVAVLNISTLPIGATSITASYPGDSSFAGSTATAVSVFVTPATTTTVLTSSAATVVSGTSVKFTATVSSPGGTPTGSVNFLNGTSALGTVTLNATGVATYSTTLPVGTASITAAYPGSSTFAASTSAPVSVVVPPPDFTLGIAPAALSLAPGASGSATLTLTPQNGFNTATTFACSGLPSLGTCTLTPASLTPDGTKAATTQVAIGTTAASSLSNPFVDRGRPLYAFVLPGLGALLVLGRFRKRLPPAMRGLGMIAITLGLAIGISACGGGPTTPKNPGTPAGTSTVTITATSGTTSHTATVAVTVTP